MEAYPGDFAAADSPAVQFLLEGDDAPGGRLVEAVATAVEVTEAPENTGLATAAVRMTAHATPEQLDRMRKRMAAWPRAMLEPLFLHDDGIPLVSGPVSVAMVERIANWTPTASDHDEVTGDADALTSAGRHGWQEASAHDRVAQALNAQASAVASDPASQPVAETIIGLLSDGKPSDAIDQLGKTFGQEVAGGVHFFRWALRLPLTEAARGVVAQRFDLWASATQLETVEVVLKEHRDALDGAGRTYRSNSVRSVAQGRDCPCSPSCNGG